MHEDKYERIREHLRLQAEQYDRQLQQKEEEQLENVMSFSEYFDKSFYKLAKKVKYNKQSLYTLLLDDITLNRFPIHGELKNNFDNTDVKTQILEIIKNINKNDYSQLVKYKNTIKITKSYQCVYIFDYNCRCVITTARSRFVKYRCYDGCVTSNTNLVDIEHQEIIDFPKGKLNIENIKKSYFNEIIPSIVTPHQTTKTITQIYSKIKRKATKYLEESTKTIHFGTNYCLRAVDFDKIYIKKVLIPVYTLHCKKPGFDIKYTINANSKRCI